MLATLAATFAIVTGDQTALRAAPRDSAQQQAVLWAGDALEIRGERLGFYQVYDHRRERGGYVRETQVRANALKPGDAPELLSVIRFLRDTPGQEALGIAYTAAYIQAAPAEAIGAELFDALGSMADRLARRASARKGRADDAAVAAHLEVAANYGVKMVSLERNERVQICYDGEAFRRVMALPTANDEQRARAALALTRPECVDPNLRPLERYNTDVWRADVLGRVDVSELPDYLKNRVRLRQAGVWSSLAFEHARRGEDAAPSASHALEALAGINKTELAEEDQSAYTEAAVRVGASRWAIEQQGAANTTRLAVLTAPGQPGETCVQLVDTRQPKHVALLQRCTYGQVWAASATVNAQGNALALAVQPLDSWRELWLFHRSGDTWVVDVLPPSSSDPDMGYIEFAGWVPGGQQMLAVREARVEGRFQRKFDVIRIEDLNVQKEADRAESLSLFQRWQDPAWKGQTVSIR